MSRRQAAPSPYPAKRPSRTDDLKMTLLTGTKGAFAPLGVHAALFRTRSGRRGGRSCQTFLRVLRGRRMYCIRLVLRAAARSGGEPWSRRLQATATDGDDLHCAADVGARSDHARCRGGAGAGNRWRIGATVAGREESPACRFLTMTARDGSWYLV